jgi:hypothetical protein
VTGTPDDSTFVSFAGPAHDGLEMGDQGKILRSAGHSGAHVQWVSGARRGEITLEYTDDLVPVTGHRVAVATPTSSDGLEDSLEVGVPQNVSLPHLCALRGPGAVLNVIASDNSNDFAAVAQKVRSFAEAQIAATAGIQRVIAELDEEEVAEVVRLATVAVIRDTFGLADG